MPAVNQVELHPYFTQPALREVHAELGILPITELAAKYAKTPAQIVLRWHIEQVVDNS